MRVLVFKKKSLKLHLYKCDIVDKITRIVKILYKFPNITVSFVFCSKDVLVEFSSLTNLSSETMSKSYANINKATNGVRPSGEYDEFLDKHR